MKIVIESTDTVIAADGVRARLWHGVTEGGRRCDVYVQRIGDRGDPAAAAELAAALHTVLSYQGDAAPNPAGPSTSEEEALALGLAGVPPVLELGVSREQAVALVAVVQLASRHPTARGLPIMRAAVRTARALQDALATHSPDVGRLMERGWHPVFDVPGGGPAVEP